ncbi:hypothetical protein [Aliamphritea spongicola]|nr:hypothetical protein [Aliamphritea spongicola]
MAEHTGKLINNQRHLLEDLSHELRTPLARLDMAVEHVGQGLQPDEALQRLRGVFCDAGAGGRYPDAGLAE